MSTSQAKWSTLAQVKSILLKKWSSGLFLRDCLEPAGIFPFRVPLRGPGPSALSEKYDRVREWVRQFPENDTTQQFQVEWRQINNRVLGKNRLPVAVVFESWEKLLRYIGKTIDCRLFEKTAGEVLAVFPSLKEWILKHPFVLLEKAPVAGKLLRIAEWMRTTPKPGIYLRQLSLPDIDTKFMESHKKLLTEWFDVILDQSNIDFDATGVKGFERRYGFLEKPVQVRFRILDRSRYLCGFSDLTVRADEFCALDPDVRTVFITENDINGLSFPMVDNSIVVFGRGYGFDYLRDADWLKSKEILYWGDIDTHGFSILSQFRKPFPSVKSFLMDRETLLFCKEYWVEETTPSDATLGNLTVEEHMLYTDLQSQHFGRFVRLEQEFIPFDYVERNLNKIVKKMRVDK
jgi:hypothetical protein